jgi:predicted DNA-binding transcriptional regulator AlpA
MSKPLKIGNSVRWDVQFIRDWTDGGCEPVGE